MPLKSVQYLPNGIRVGTMMIRDGLHLPNVPGMETDAYSRQWRSVQALDSFNLGRKLDAIGWHLFFVAGHITTVAFGLAGEKSVNRAVQRIVAKVSNLDLNCLELTTIARKRFLGLPYIEIYAHSFHIQQGWLLQSLEERRRSAAQIKVDSKTGVKSVTLSDCHDSGTTPEERQPSGLPDHQFPAPIH